MTEFWEAAFNENQTMWGLQPAASALLAGDYFASAGVKEVLIPGVGYGRNAKAFLERGMSVTGIEISETAISFARTELGLQIPIHHGSVADMPYDERQYDGVFCYALLHLLDPAGRQKLLQSCYHQLAPDGHLFFTVVSKQAPMYGEGRRLGADWYERMPGLRMFFYDAASVEREFGAYGLIEFSERDEPMPSGGSLPFFNVICRKS